MKGFTLIEILVGLTIVGMLFGVGFVSYRDFTRRQNLASIGKQLQGYLRLSQANASSGIKPDAAACNPPNSLNDYAFEIASPQEYTIVAECSGIGSQPLPESKELPSGITMSTPSVNPIRFKVLGEGNNIPAGQTAIITLTQAGTGNTFTVVVTSGGEIK